jgi:hypothetical protein
MSLVGTLRRSSVVAFGELRMWDEGHPLAKARNSASSAVMTASWWHSSQVTASERTLSERMLPRVMGPEWGEAETIAA